MPCSCALQLADLCRQHHDSRAENRAAWITGISLSLLCLYVLAGAAAALLTRTEPDRSVVGIVAALGLLCWLGHEVREALEGALAGRGGCSCGDDCCEG